jgi:hypothetical protein
MEGSPENSCLDLKCERNCTSCEEPLLFVPDQVRKIFKYLVFKKILLLGKKKKINFKI